MYDHGARNRNPISTLWYGIDPLFEKYPDFSPYNYCAGNPVKLLDPDGRAAINGYECKYSKQANSETLSNETDYVQAYQIIKMGGYEKDKAYHYMGHGVQIGDNNSAFVYAIDYKGNPIKDNKKLHSIIFESKSDEPDYICVVFHSCKSGESFASPAVSYSISYPDEYVIAPNNEVTSGVGYDSEDNCSIVFGCEYVAGADGRWKIFKAGEVIGTIDGKETPLYDNIVKEIKKYENEAADN